MTTLSMDTRDDLPKVPYPTALDWFIIMCYFFVTATLLEYTGVHYFTKIGSGDVIYEVTASDAETENQEEVVSNKNGQLNYVSIAQNMLKWLQSLYDMGQSSNGTMSISSLHYDYAYGTLG